MYLLFAIGFSSKGFRVFSSKSVTSKIADGGAKIVPNGVSCISLKIIHQILKCYFSVLLQQVPQLCHLSLVWYPYIMVLTKNLSCLGLPHALPYLRVVYMLRANNALCPKQISKVIVSTFLKKFGVIFQIVQQILLSLNMIILSFRRNPNVQ